MNRNSMLYRVMFNTSKTICGAADVVGIGVFKSYDGVMFAGDKLGEYAREAWRGLKDGAALRNAPPALIEK